ncbi:hypothetical protein O9X80_11110 [Agrobacterium salinitolerans]|uniref:hypothetical protein n=1 Tax=Agrobacterium salinitolerans TaxID=1183413 RepID=UPI0022B8144B|nr:hypothetical protein [Agrobacterium salinitolerans]MCZ7975036.1 hypothetical protein [Agrobacterium salinitolerans]
MSEILGSLAKVMNMWVFVTLLGCILVYQGYTQNNHDNYLVWQEFTRAKELVATNQLYTDFVTKELDALIEKQNDTKSREAAIAETYSLRNDINRRWVNSVNNTETVTALQNAVERPRNTSLNLIMITLGVGMVLLGLRKWHQREQWGY